LRAILRLAPRELRRSLRARFMRARAADRSIIGPFR